MTRLFYGMKKLISIPLILILGILLSGCPYESPFPIDTPGIKIDPKILGTWEELKDHAIYKIAKKDNFTYSIEITEQKDCKVDRNIGYLSAVNGVMFLNLLEDKPSVTEKKYSFYKLKITSTDKLSVSPVTSNIREQFNSSSSLKKFIAANMKNSYFFEPEASFIRRGNQ